MSHQATTMAYLDDPDGLLLDILSDSILAPSSVCSLSTKEPFRNSNQIKSLFFPKSLNGPLSTPQADHLSLLTYFSEPGWDVYSLKSFGFTSHASYILGGLLWVTGHIHYVMILLMELWGNYLIFFISTSVFGGHLPGSLTILILF